MNWYVDVQTTRSFYTGKTTHVYISQERKPGKRIGSYETRLAALTDALRIVEEHAARGVRVRMTVDGEDDGHR